MPRWTEEQQSAIDTEGANIIVSAGAGSGKTAVLSERVIRKLESGVDVDRLLILTFTKAAAFEMMIRIRNKIKERPHLHEQLKKIDSAYITTFDSFSLSLVKKYHYLLNIKRNIKIINQNIMDQERRKILDEIFDEYYEKEDARFLHLLDTFTLKDDTDIKNLILGMNQKLDLKYDKLDFISSYLKDFDMCQETLLEEFVIFLKDKIKLIESCLEELKLMVDGDYFASLEDVVLPLINSNSYDEMKKNSEIKLKMLPRGSEEDVKQKKEELTSYIKELNQYFIYESEEEIRRLLLEQKPYLEILIEMIFKLDERVNFYKFEHDVYEFTDISKMAIQLVLENVEIRDELKYYFNEIMVDEYQDTSDLQEEFISKLENNNVYMVGDIKQSIYRFRNANPLIFKNKYTSYGKGDGGIKIDLMKNFRSRREVLQNINDVFDFVMDEDLGGCDYRATHRMIFGNTSYEKEETHQNSDFEIYNYESVEKFTKDEVEAFIILKDIKEKIDNKYQVIDKETFTLRDITYSDFAILMDRATKFELYKKIFEYHKVPLTVYKDTSITEEEDVLVLSNLFKFIYLSYHKDYSKEFEYTYTSIARSYLMNETDQEIFDTITSKKIFESKLYQLIRPIIDKYPVLNGYKLLDEVSNIFKLYEAQIGVGNMESLMARIFYLKTLFQEMGEVGYSIDDVILSFSEMVKMRQDIKISSGADSGDAVKIMTIHKSKGLEFPILYMAGLSNSFNIRDLNDKFIFDNTYGFILPFYKEEEIASISKFMMKDAFLEEEISEKIRLFYVALTRAREKMILLTNNEKEEDYELFDVVSKNKRFRYRSFLDILKSIWSILLPFKKQIDINTLNLSKDYNMVLVSNYKETLKKQNEKIIYREQNENFTKNEKEKFSKSMSELLTSDNMKAMEEGKYFHEIFESVNFQKPDYSYLTEYEARKVQKFLQNPVLDGIMNAKIYKELEFSYQEDKKQKHGIIDLLIEMEDKILLIDYKLKNVVDLAYKKQLLGYKSYVNAKTKKEIEVYLYSIIDEVFTKID